MWQAAAKKAADEAAAKKAAAEEKAKKAAADKAKIEAERYFFTIFKQISAINRAQLETDTVIRGVAKKGLK